MLDLRCPEQNTEYYERVCQGDCGILCHADNYEHPRVEFLRRRATGRVLDVGCCTGDFTAALETGFAAVGLDPSWKHIEIARARYPQGHFVRGFVEGYSQEVRRLFGNARPFDTALAGDVLEHVPNPDDFIQALLTVATRAVLTTPLGEWDSPEHIHVFSEPDGVAFATRFGGECHVLRDRDGNPRWLGLVLRKGARESPPAQ